MGTILHLYFLTNWAGIVVVKDGSPKKLDFIPSLTLWSIIKAIEYFKSKYSNIHVKTIIIDDNSNKENLSQIKKIIENKNIDIEPLEHSKYQDIIKKQKNQQTFANLASLLQSFEIGKEKGEDLIFFIEDDYIHFEPMLEEIIASYERIASQLNREIFMCPADYPYLYTKIENSKLEELIVTDSVPNIKPHSKIKMLSCADLFSDVMHKVHSNQSISSNFIM